MPPPLINPPDSATDRPARFGDLPSWHARRRPDAVALRFEGGDLRWRDFAARCDEVARTLREVWSIGAGDRIAWLGHNHPEQLVLLFALARIGAILVPLNTRLATGEWSRLLADSTPVRLVHNAAFAEAAETLTRGSPTAVSSVQALTDSRVATEKGRTKIDAAAAVDASSDFSDDADPETAVLLVYTSGTTGRPRGALHTSANLLAGMRIASTAQSMTAGDRVLTVLPLFHVGGLCIQTLPALFVGATVLLHPRFTADAAIDAIARERPTLTLQVPATMQALAAHARWPALDLSCLRAVWAGSSVLPRAAIDAFHARGVPVCNVYGATETGPFSIALPPERAVSHPGSCGWAAQGVEVRLEPLSSAHRGGDAAGPSRSDEGELWIRAPNVARRYWPGEPSVDADGWFHTGDLARRAADGAFTVVGRSKELIISGGENIHPAEIDEALATHPSVLECAAFGLADAAWGEVVAVMVVRREGHAATEAELRAHLELRLARFKQPRRWVFVDALPKTALGKVQRGALARMLSNR